MEDNQNLTAEEREQKRKERAERLEKGMNKETRNRFLLWLSVIILIIAVIVAMVMVVGKGGSDGDVTIAESVTAKDWVKGNPEATTTLIEYADFECPACAQYHPVIKQLEEEYGDKIRFVYRHFPLQQHINARPSARAAEAAGLQGKFFEMHDLIYTNQKEWAAKPNGKEIFRRYAEELGLNMEKYDNDYESRQIGDKISEDYTSGVKYGVKGTPTFYLNNTKLSPKSFEDFRRSIAESIEGAVNN
ncbi:MAG: hypothetical protein A3G52_01790 [Candidatus Taylorbacteria bacterium RIFCSPLOWO2_12_FULL_43_20]|uniref:Thioredoxin domain-containing protein n=1 Tax=Candidatus Taylorbacteria bacterium RIFCSPLOWO2_12_FULL_43_20 TaxID=1802332 RepID=A0A1G2P0Y4_9BACT|nr:MAG: hypothetical protein A3B98_00275 [Candidatus Taylorbacteria bacterium RIFCSPHIGHO2_02_FULL_43_55]OHA29934.1 MAG: hypothetical protein A3E92_03905 [Candidatus Taylorbacteria bacterium RIFCSPHIGHO2_12_FULL_42_34]OHA30566.1 MAG: hypothetical protein A3B09_01525 [Candidatus Taylorbacteria bacterium RIFCSPLOWO2_01_FULL_43_83]OHA38398.1 MAG: hypothetical protein A3H58_04330 [Candidatus Taylorbacteria bacterium RIFCSPLOWO2_02_FULL_43_22b]OHA42006.1 MAG: hypothetical protein A3G52_01790 [Candid